jgi:gamma-glutamylcyclotransferase (GGCT)/AIG2-like uncharacterized protein YtfP
MQGWIESQMKSAPTVTVPLFCYGTLQEKPVQIANFGRELKGRADALPGYVQRMVTVVGSGGEATYPNAVPSANADEALLGTVYEITEEELVAADKYEEDADYRRIWVTLRSGAPAWVYLRE